MRDSIISTTSGAWDLHASAARVRSSMSGLELKVRFSKDSRKRWRAFCWSWRAIWDCRSHLLVYTLIRSPGTSTSLSSRFSCPDAQWLDRSTLEWSNPLPTSQRHFLSCWVHTVFNFSRVCHMHMHDTYSDDVTRYSSFNLDTSLYCTVTCQSTKAY